jgi:hypothetical protein
MRIAIKTLRRAAMIAALTVVSYFGSFGPLLYCHEQIGVPSEGVLELVYGPTMELLQTNDSVPFKERRAVTHGAVRSAPR